MADTRHVRRWGVLAILGLYRSAVAAGRRGSGLMGDGQIRTVSGALRRVRRAGLAWAPAGGRGRAYRLWSRRVSWVRWAPGFPMRW